MSKTRSADDGGLSSRILRNFVGNVVGPLAGLVSAPILAQALGVAGRGEVAGATAPYMLAIAVATVGVPEATTFVIARNPRLAFRALRWGAILLVVSGLIATLAACLIAPIIAASEGEVVLLIMLASTAIVPVVLVAGLRGGAAGLHRWDLVAWERSLGPVVRLVALVVLSLTTQLDAVSATAVLAFSPVVGGLVYIPMLLRARRVRLSDEDARAVSPRSLLSYGMRVWIGAIAGVLLMRLDQILLLPVAGAYELGLYVVAVTIGELPLIVNAAVREVMFSEDARSSDTSRLSRAARISFIVCAAGSVLIGLATYLWIGAIFGDGFTDALPTCFILLVAVTLGVPGSIAGAGLSARGRPELRSGSLVVACVVNVAIVLLLSPLLGAAGAAIATLVGNLVSSNLNILLLWRFFHVSPWSFYAVSPRDVRFLVRGAVRLLRRK